MGRNYELKLKLSKNEKEKLKKKADALGLKVSTYIRMVSLKADFGVKK